jgi:hypothetical protein
MALPIKGAPPFQITDEVLDLFRRALEIEAAGGRQRELSDISVEMHRLLGLRPWEIPVLDVTPQTRSSAEYAPHE